MAPNHNENPGNGFVNLSRRQALKRIAFYSLMGFSLPKPVYASIQESHPTERFLSLYHPNTKETLNIVYWSNGDYIPEALTKINYFMRDHRTDEVKPIDPRLLDLLYAVERKTKSRKPLQIVSGYRSPETNALLRKHRRGVSKNSYHIQGKAADIWLPGYRLSSLRKVALRIKAGGVGYYPRFMFVHVDVGPIRYWRK